MKENNYIIYNRDVYKRQRDSSYYVDVTGHVYSTFCKRLINPLQRYTRGKNYYYIDVFNKETKKQQHIPLHRIVWEAWVDDIEVGMQVNHKDDNSLNNSLTNLYVGTQKENIEDCVKNEHRVGFVHKLVLYDKENDVELTFCPANDFYSYDGHSSVSKSLAKSFKTKWFQNRYEIVAYDNIKNLEEYQGVTTMRDECTSVG